MRFDDDDLSLLLQLSGCRSLVELAVGKVRGGPYVVAVTE